MFPLLLLAFIAVPIIEIYVIAQVGASLGWIETLGLLILVSVVGAWLVKLQGLTIINRVQQQLRAGELPGDALIDGALVLFAGALMLTPGFVTDAVGVVLLLPPTRVPVRMLLKRRFKGRVTTFGGPSFGTTFGRSGSGPAPDGGDVVDVDGRERSSPDDPRGLREWER